MATSPDAREWISVLRSSYEHLASIIDGLSPSQVTEPSYASEWTIAQALSHLGSGAEIFSLFAASATGDAEPPSREEFPKIWAVWDAKSPADQAADSKTANRALVEQFESLDDAELLKFHIDLFGMQLDAANFLSMRLGELALHTWDVAVALDSSATIPSDAVSLLVDTFPVRAGMLGKPTGDSFTVAVKTTDPSREFHLSVGDAVSVTEGSGGDTPHATLSIPAEALTRLSAGRMDPEHTPATVSAEGVSLEELRKVFPGF